ncbi:hypothetical protein [Halobacillus campisalis]|uniref:Uncharacterized protein n=1 Tax=Halobacillus campisalis TaxID=435909 RepID=A0ABW2K0Z8_9BACI
MDVLLWITIGFILIGFVVLVSMKRSMESKLAFIKENPESADSSIKSKAIIWWIVSTTAWGVVSIFLVVLVFS